jgi:FkbM family methyltransferase
MFDINQEKKQQYVVPSITLLDILNHFNAPNNIDYLSLDIEGSEHQAILGAERTIKKTYPIITLELKGLGSR